MPANAFTRRVMPGGVNLADVDQARYSNALLKSRVDSAPAELESLKLSNESMRQNIDMRGQQLTEGQRENARGILATKFAAIAQSQNPTLAARQLLADPNFKQAGTMLGIPVDQFTVTDQDDPEQLRSMSADWARSLGVNLGGDNARVQSTQVLEDGTIAYVTSDGRMVRTGERARNPMQVTDIGGAPSLVNRLDGGVTPLSTPGAEDAAAANRKRAETEAVASVVPADARAAAAAKSPRLAAAERRLERVAQASQTLGAGGGPIEGRLRSMAGTPAAQELEAANAQLLNELTALTRVPGIGSQSDLEQRLAALQLPTPTQHPAVRERSIQELRAFINDLNTAIGNTANPGGASQAPNGVDPSLWQYMTPEERALWQ